MAQVTIVHAVQETGRRLGPVHAHINVICAREWDHDSKF